MTLEDWRFTMRNEIDLIFNLLAMLGHIWWEGATSSIQHRYANANSENRFLVRGMISFSLA